MFAYCGNNPVHRKDPSGDAFETAVDVITLGNSIFEVIKDPDNPLAWLGLIGDIIDVAVPFVTGVGETVKVASNLVDTADDLYDAARATNNTVETLGSMCFVAGTVVYSESGFVPIEEIKVGDKVWAWDEETGEVGLKRVLDTYENETYELVHVFVNSEEIITTPAHPFYSPVKGWTQAVHLRAGDILVLVNGEYVVVEKVQHEILESPVEVYNFHVEDYHTYFVATSAVLVHNSCGITADLYHYTTSEGAESIMKSGVILPDNRGRVFVTTDKIPAADVNNALFMGQKPNSGTYVVEIYLVDPNDFRLVADGATQPNELIYMGALRNGKNAMLVVKENLFNG